jgi:hypothetical protein
MICALCQKSIADYDVMYHQLKLNDSKTVEICSDCTKLFLKWQQNIFAQIYPTKQAKKFARKG